MSSKVIDVCIESVSLTVYGVEILQEAAVKLTSGKRYGLVGRNGVGKTCLLRRMAESQARSHIVTKYLKSDLPDFMSSIPGWPQHVSVYLVKQEAELSDETALDVISSSHILLQELIQIEEMLTNDPDTDPAELDELYEQLTLIDEASIESRIQEVLRQLKFTKEMQEKKISELSGGWRMRVSLACALVNDPDVLILDEPCNHLDIKAVMWLQNFLMNEWKKTLITVSHDKYFMNAVCTDVIHFFEKKLTYFTGNFDDYEASRAARILRYNNLQDKIDRERDDMRELCDRLEKNINKGGDQKKSSMVASRRKKILRHGSEKTADGQRYSQQKHTFRLGCILANEGGYVNGKLSGGNLKEAKESEVKFNFMEPKDIGLNKNDIMVQLNNISFSFHEDPKHMSDYIFTDVSLTITPTSRIAVFGPNGAGKSTLLGLICGTLNVSKLIHPSNNIRHNTIYRQHDLVITYFTQHNIENLDQTLNAVELMRKAYPDDVKDAREQDIRQHLGRFGITQRLGKQIVGTMSGGQKTRVALAIVTFVRPHILILDEPTNHLDYYSVKALIDGLADYKGAVIVVTHNREFVSQVFDDLLIVEKYEKKVVKKSVRQKAREKKAKKNTSKKKSNTSNDDNIKEEGEEGDDLPLSHVYICHDFEKYCKKLIK